MVIPAARHDEREASQEKTFLWLEYDDAKQHQRIKVPLRALALFFSLFALFKQRLTKMRDRTRLSLTEHLSFCFFLIKKSERSWTKFRPVSTSDNKLYLGY